MLQHLPRIAPFCIETTSKFVIGDRTIPFTGPSFRMVFPTRDDREGSAPGFNYSKLNYRILRLHAWAPNRCSKEVAPKSAIKMLSGAARGHGGSFSRRQSHLLSSPVQRK